MRTSAILLAATLAAWAGPAATAQTAIDTTAIATTAAPADTTVVAPAPEPDTANTGQAELAAAVPGGQEAAAPSGVAPAKKRNLFLRFLDYFNDANKNKHHKKFDFSIIGGPHYSTDTKFGVGLAAAGLYHHSAADSLYMPSNISLYGDASSVGFFMMAVKGDHLFPRDRFRLNYTFYIYTFPGLNYGIGFDNGDNPDNQTHVKRMQVNARVAFLVRLSKNVLAGPVARFDYINAKEPSVATSGLDVFGGQPLKLHNLGIGVALTLDSRDVMTNPHRGAYINFTQYFRPHFLGNDYVFQTTELDIRGYRRVWKGGILAAQFLCNLNFGNPTWPMMATFGSSGSMRGYYEGRYRDKHKWEGQLELRQHVWKRNGIVVWVGAGQVFHRMKDLQMRTVLHNFGAGYRWEFKKNVNVRLDYGFGRCGQSGFMFGINEAF